jgi:short-subunit dehydrogenase
LRKLCLSITGEACSAHYALQYLKETQGRIVTIISGGGKFVTPGSCGYGASKHAMVGFFDSLRIELAESGVCMTSIYPDWVATGISSRSLEADRKPGDKIAAQEQDAN